MTPGGRKLETARITNSPAELRRAIAGAGTHPKVVLEATYGWYWAVPPAHDALQADIRLRRRWAPRIAGSLAVIAVIAALSQWLH
jgi:hypothetical protein